MTIFVDQTGRRMNLIQHQERTGIKQWSFLSSCDYFTLNPCSWILLGKQKTCLQSPGWPFKIYVKSCHSSMHMPAIIPISLGMKARNYIGLQGPAWFDLQCLLGFIFGFSCLIHSASVTVAFSHFLQHSKRLLKYRISTCYSLCLEYFPSIYLCCSPPSRLCSDVSF